MAGSQTIVKQPAGPKWAYLADGNSEKLAETLVAFANGDGGTLVLGMNEQGRLGSLLAGEEAEELLRAALRLCRPPVRTDWQQEQMPEGMVVLLRVERSGTVHSLWDGRILVRKGADNQPIDGEEFHQLFVNRPSGDFETEIVAGTTRDDLDGIVASALAWEAKLAERNSTG